VEVIDRGALVRALSGRRTVADWLVVERDVDTASVDGSRRRRDRRVTWTVIAHVDVPQGRGSARLELGSIDGSPDEAIDNLVALANAAVGPAWASVPPAAPAKVVLLDPALATADLGDAAVAIAKRVAALAIEIEVTREKVAVEARSGFRTSWTASLIRGRALVAAGERSLDVMRESRRADKLELDLAIAEAASDLELAAKARRPTGGRCALVVAADAFLHGGGLGMWQTFASQADAIVERQGLTRYRVGKPIAEGAPAVAEPLGIDSDGAQAFGVRSAPVGDEGDAVRTFKLVERGLCVGLGLSPREAALRKQEPNGGVRDLVIVAGTWTGDKPEGRVVEIRRLRSLSIDRYTGDASLEIGLGLDGDQPFTGGTVHLDLIAALARARRSSSTIDRGPYHGPKLLLIEGAELVA
jgi:predicted Zn-dependent protease